MRGGGLGRRRSFGGQATGGRAAETARGAMLGEGERDREREEGTGCEEGRYSGR